MNNNFFNSKLPFLIAEISANHCGNFNSAKKLIRSAKKNGANAVKLQTFTADSMTMKSDKKIFKIKDGLWKGYTLWDLYDEAKTPLSWHKELFRYGKKIGITIFSTPFDENAVDFLEDLKCPIYKISSFEMTDFPLIKKVSKTNKPIIISTGTSNIDEISDTYNFAKKNGARDITLLYCVSEYPASVDSFNMNNIKILKEKFNCRVGLSDHSKDEKIASLAIACGAEVIEKHIALENQNDGLDIEFSLKGKELRNFRRCINESFQIIGENSFQRSKSELDNKLFRRSIFAVKDIKKGEKFTNLNIKRIRPGNGISPKYYEYLLNKRSPQKIVAGSPIKIKVLDKLKKM